MQTEKLPTNTPAAPTGPDGSPEVVKNTPAEQIAQSDRIFWLCFIPAVVIFALVCLWLNYADIYGTGRTQAEQHRIKVQVYRPPVKHPKKKPPPKPPKVKPPPPRPIQHFVKPPPPVRHIPPPPAPRAPSVGHVVHTQSPTAIPVGPVAPTPTPAVPVTPGNDVRPQAPIVAPPAPPPPVIEKPAPPPPPPPVVHHEAPPPPPPPPPPPKKPAIPDRNEPDQTSGSFSAITLPDGVDVGSLNGSSTTVSWEVDADGHARNIKFRPTGNSDLDNTIRDQVSRFRYKPAVHNGVPEAVTISHTFAWG